MTDDVAEARARVWDAFRRMSIAEHHPKKVDSALLVTLSMACGTVLDDFEKAVRIHALTPRDQFGREIPLAPLCYICGVLQTKEHAALTHTDYGLAE